MGDVEEEVRWSLLASPKKKKATNKVDSVDVLNTGDTPNRRKHKQM